MEKERLVIIHQCRGVGWKTIAEFFRFDPSLETIFRMKKSDFVKYFNMKKNNVDMFYHDLHRSTYHDLKQSYKEQHINVMTIFDERYPPLLRNIYDPPWVLYYIGNPDYFHYKCLAVVGTRNPSINGIKSMQHILPPIIKQGWTIVSGLALGVDACAHQLSIAEKGRTIAVLGAGLRHLYPAAHRSLARTIAREHLLISEFPPHFPPQKWQFPIRNRVISGLSYGTLVIEAQEKRGSLITADQALEQGREVFAVPGSILHEQSRGTNRLIQYGAKLVLDSEDILVEFEQNG